jgi:Pvc16 N-terminal domain
MSSPLAIAAVTAALKDLLNDGLLNHDLSSVGSFSVTALPPDRISTGQTEPNQLNLFLYQVTPNMGWRNVGLPSRDSNGVRLSAAPLALDLHYLLTAYGSQDLNAEILLGYAMQLLHETPVLTRAQLRIVLGAPSPVNGAINALPAPFGPLTAIDLADQIEMIKITPVFLGTEDLSKMWTAMQARYRPTMAYMASVVLIETTNTGKAAPPVLKRGADDAGNAATAAAFPTLARVRPRISELLPAMRLGDDLLITGSNLNDLASMQVVIENSRAGIVQQITPTVGEKPSEIIAHVPGLGDDPDAINQWAIGLYAVSLQVNRPSLPTATSNAVPIALAPLITVDPLEAAVGDVALTVTCTPRLRPEQETAVRLIFGSRTIQADTIVTPSTPDTPDMQQPTTLTFTVPSVLEGDYIVRLRVDGVDSLPVTISGSPAKFEFDPQQTVNVKVI